MKDDVKEVARDTRELEKELERVKRERDDALASDAVVDAAYSAFIEAQEDVEDYQGFSGHIGKHAMRAALAEARAQLAALSREGGHE